MRNIYLLSIFTVCVVAATYWYLKPEPSVTLAQQSSFNQKSKVQENLNREQTSEMNEQNSLDHSIEPVDTKSDLSIKPIDPDTDPGNQVLDSK